MLPLLLKVSLRCRKKTLGPEENEECTDCIRCIGSKGCAQTWTYPRNRQRILAHASKCNWLPTKYHEAALEQMADKAIGPVAEISLGPTSISTVGNDETGRMSSLASQWDLDSTSGLVGKKIQMFESCVAEGQQELKEKGDYAIMQFIVCCGVPPVTVDSNEFKFMVATLNSRYQPPSSSTLTSKLIPNEAAKLSLAVKQHLAKCRHLTITFNGGKTRQPHSIYTIHVTTGDCRTFCLDIDDASRLSHSADYILEALDQVRILLTVIIRKYLPLF